MFSARLVPMPDTRASQPAPSRVWPSTPTALTPILHTASSECDNLVSLRSCWYGRRRSISDSILTSSASGPGAGGDRDRAAQGGRRVRGVPADA